MSRNADHDLNALLDVAFSAAVAGGNVLLRYWNSGVSSRSKEGGKSYDLVSDADLESQAAVVKVIEAACPGHSILGEEDLQVDTNVQHLWVVDPLDGTNNFAHRVPHFAVSIAYFQDGVPSVGVVHSPVTGSTYSAVRGQFSRCGVHRIRCDETSELSKSLVGCGFYYDRGDMMRSTLAAIEEFFGQDIHGIRRLGTASLDLCAVASGRFGAFFEYKLSPWDYAAGQLIVTEAGGKITDARGNPLGLTPSSVLAAGENLHAAALAITMKHHPAPK
ncbi:MAG: inositol monophosphatase family protein [Planctomycetota bacterium]